MTLRRFSLALVFLMSAAFVTAVGQVPQQEKIHFTVSSSFEIKGANLLLPAGNYVLF